MKVGLCTGVIGAILMAGTLCADDSAKPKSDTQKQSQHSSDIQRAIAFEHYKDAAAARQARREAKHPTQFNTNADRQQQEQNELQGRTPVKAKK